MTARSKLTDALRLLRAEKADEALVALLDVWAETRSPTLAVFLEKVSADLDQTLPPVDFAAHSSSGAALQAALESAGPLDVGPLIIAIQQGTRTSPGTYAYLVRLAAKFPDDPRIATALHALVLEPPFARSEGALYGNVVSALEQLNDPRYLPEIVKWSARLETRRRYIRKERKDLDVLLAAAQRIEKRKPQVAPAWIDEALASASAPAARRRTDDGATLLAAIYEDPGDTTKRLVYADYLAERGDPRGEFITLQCTREVSARPSARERTLLKNHGRAWLGPLESGIRKQGVVYRRGFLAEARECARDEQHRDPSWATIEALELDSLTWGPRAIAFADRDDLRALERLYLRGEDAAQLKRVRPKLRVLGLRGVSADHLAEVLASGCYPALEVLELDARGRGIGAALAGAKLSKQLVLRIANRDLREVAALAGVVPSVEFIDGTGMSDDRTGWTLRFFGERLEKLHVSCTDASPKPYWVNNALKLLAPGSLVSVTGDENVDVPLLFGNELKRLGV